MNRSKEDILVMINILGREHRQLIKESVQQQNMVRARVISYIGVESLRTGEGEKLNKNAISTHMKRLVKEKIDPVFVESIAHIIESMEVSKKRQDKIFREIGKLVEELHISDWINCKDQKGCSTSMLGKLLYVAGGDLDNYENPAKLWKRFGLAVIKGKRQGNPGKDATAEDWILHGYDREKRAIAHQLGEGLLKQGTKWKKVYEWYKDNHRMKLTGAGVIVCPSVKIPKGNKSGDGYYLSDGHLHKRAMRYMEKKFLEFLWVEWTGNKIWNKDMLPYFLKEVV